MCRALGPSLCCEAVGCHSGVERDVRRAGLRGMDGNPNVMLESACIRTGLCAVRKAYRALHDSGQERTSSALSVSISA